MRIIKVATDDGNAYYDIVSRLKRTHLQFSSLLPGQAVDSVKELVITSRSENAAFGGTAVPIEDLDEDPLIMEGQLLSRLVDEPRRRLLIGIDPGSKIGVAVFYDGKELGAQTLNSVEEVVKSLVKVANEVPHSFLSVKIGNGEPKTSLRLARSLRKMLPPSASTEIVDESGTSLGKRGAIGATRDQRAAARIAFRKGTQFSDLELSRRSRG
jgi:predicted RNase H-like nuclease (RuvC/YqgF family)